MASPRRTNATAIVRRTIPPRSAVDLDAAPRREHVQDTARIDSVGAVRATSCDGGGPSSGGSAASERTPHTTIPRGGRPAAGPSASAAPSPRGDRRRALTDAAANTDAMISPTGVATTKPTLGRGGGRPAWPARGDPGSPALARKASETEDEPGVPVAAGGDVRHVGEDDVDRGRQEHQPEVARMVLPLDIELRAGPGAARARAPAG